MLFLKILFYPFLIVLFLLVVFFVLLGKILEILGKASIEIGVILGSFVIDVLEVLNKQ